MNHRIVPNTQSSYHISLISYKGICLNIIVTIGIFVNIVNYFITCNVKTEK